MQQIDQNAPRASSSTLSPAPHRTANYVYQVATVAAALLLLMSAAI